MSIAEYVKFKKIEKIVLACDGLGIKNKSVLDPLKELALLFKAQINVLNVFHELKKAPAIYNESTEGFANLNTSLKNTNHTLNYSANENVVDGINDFAAEQKMDLVVMIPRTHSFLKNIFQEPNTKKMAFHTTIPLLTLRE